MWYVDPPESVTMRIPEQVRKCVVFLGYKTASGETRFAGTGFFLGRVVETVQGGIGFRYLVTARHVIDGIKDKGISEVLFRGNKKDGTSQWFGTQLADW